MPAAYRSSSSPNASLTAARRRSASSPHSIPSSSPRSIASSEASAAHFPDADVGQPLHLPDQLVHSWIAWSSTRDSARVDVPADHRVHGSMPRDTTRRISAAEARRRARIAKDRDDLSDVYRGRPTRPKKL
jgi:hypothetical protein